MNKIQWENYQDGDSTPLSAENLNLMQDNIEEELGKKANQTTTYTKTEVDTSLDLKADKTEILPSFTRLRLSSQFNINVSGDISVWMINSQYNSEITTNGTQINLPIGIYRISLSIFYRHLAGAGATQSSIYIVHGSTTDIARAGLSGTTVNSFYNVSLPGIIVQSGGDTIKVRYEGFGTSGYFSANIDTYLNIEKIGE